MTQSSDDAIVLSGCGWVTPPAVGSISDVLTAVTSNAVDSTAGKVYWAIPDERVAQYPDLSKELRRDRGAWITAIAVEHAVRTAALNLESCDMTRVGLVLGCGLAGQSGMIDFANEVRGQSVRFVSPIHFPQTVGNYIAAAIARGFGLRGPNITLASGMVSGLDAIIEAYRLIDGGKADVVFAGGTEQLSNALAEGMTEPGTVLSEGACVFVLERLGSARSRGTAPLAVLTTANSSNGCAFVSVAGHREAGAVYIESDIGRCIGASGAAAVAAAIGAASGSPVPVINKDDLETVSRGTIRQPSDTESCMRAVVRAGKDDAHVTSLDLQFMG